tara:strand:+ start:2462 stop:3085 length:624 start_codon:yes stop_codon:yes gene_type:complete
MRKIYTLDNVSYNCNKKLIIKNFNHIIEEGVTVIKGPNGAGKTTILKLLFGLISPTTGYIKRHFSLCDNEASYIFQNPVFLQRTVEENLKHVLLCKNIDKSKWSQLINNLVNNYSLNSILASHVNLLSGGELQLLSLLRSIIIKPKILFYDEPTNNLDHVNIKLVKKIISNLHDNGTSIIMVSHNIDLYENIEYKEILIDHGQKKHV